MSWENGKYPVKIYTIDGVLIYQVENGTTNNGKLPLGGVVVQNSVASSMLDAIANPIIHYGSGAVINQDGHSGDLYSYYWTSYSRGTDGRVITTTWTNEPNWHNAYLDGYISLRVKSIYDPCPYLYRTPSNGTYNQFVNPGWTTGASYLGGLSWNITTLGESWLSGLGRRGPSIFEHTGGWGFYYSSTTSSQTNGYLLHYNSGKATFQNCNDRQRSTSLSVRCIEDTRRYAHTFCQQKVCKNCRDS